MDLLEDFNDGFARQCINDVTPRTLRLVQGLVKSANTRHVWHIRKLYIISKDAIMNIYVNARLILAIPYCCVCVLFLFCVLFFESSLTYEPQNLFDL
jgi:hypothetical protein